MVLCMYCGTLKGVLNRCGLTAADANVKDSQSSSLMSFLPLVLLLMNSKLFFSEIEETRD